MLSLANELKSEHFLSTVIEEKGLKGFDEGEKKPPEKTERNWILAKKRGIKYTYSTRVGLVISLPHRCQNICCLSGGAGGRFSIGASA